MYLSTVNELDTSKYFRANLLGGKIKYNVDLSQAGCGCVTALYTVLMPAVDNNSDPFKYCDANQVGGHWCPEFDIMEANKYAFRAVGHACDAPDNSGKFHNCDRSGECHIDVLTNNLQKDYGPSITNTINTERAFSVETSFHESSGVFTGYTTVLEQDGKQVVLEASNCGYLSRMTTDMTDMAFVISNWGSGNLNWLQHGVCTGSCSASGTLSVISDFQIFTNSFAPPAPPSPPADDEEEPVNEIIEPLKEYYYAKPCNERQDQSLCTEGCDCFVSWPADDPKKWRSDDKACRCLPKQMAPEAYEYKRPCKKPTNGACNGCDECMISWPLFDDLRSKSAERMCRC